MNAENRFNIPVEHRVGPLFTDLYELTMAAGYHARQMTADATFSLFIRDYPPRRNYFVAAGLQDALHELENYRFSESDIDYLRQTGLFSPDFLNHLESFHFTGNVHAMPEGTLFFANEPVLEVSAPLIEAQVLETFLLNTVGFQTLIATKAARCFHAAAGRSLIDFGLRRTHGHDAGVKAARSMYIAGFSATSNVLAGQVYGIPISGTMAHSYIQAFGSDGAAFEAFAEAFPDNAVFLIDTYDTLEGARATVRTARKLQKKGIVPVGVRLDSGDMARLSRDVRKILDDGGFPQIKIFASSGFDEYKIADVLSRKARIDAFGVGTKVGVSADAPYFDIVYKMVRYAGRDVRKYSPGKVTLAGRKQVFRLYDKNGMCREDYIGRREDTVAGRRPLLEPVMENGRPVRSSPSLQEIRQRFVDGFDTLDLKFKDLTVHTAYPVKITPQLSQLQAVVDA
jgi:nicotinate phosphoribosyltransferase